MSVPTGAASTPVGPDEVVVGCALTRPVRLEDGGNIRNIPPASSTTCRCLLLVVLLPPTPPLVPSPPGHAAWACGQMGLTCRRRAHASGGPSLLASSGSTVRRYYLT